MRSSVTYGTLKQVVHKVILKEANVTNGLETQTAGKVDLLRNNAFRGDTNLIKPDGVTSIESGAFSWLPSVILPSADAIARHVDCHRGCCLQHLP
jgi:hypothetical protein